ncbi:MAG: GNAT family N-acetyltransferase [Candidatus Rokuibacteriota bacterium]
MIRVRRARLDDARRIRDLHVRSIRVLCRRHYTPRQIAAWSGRLRPSGYRWAMRAGRETMLVAEDGRRLVGFGSLRGDMVRAVYVHARRPGRGIGTRLLAALEGYARRRGVRRLRLDATRNGLLFYAARGYRVVRRHAVRLGGVPIPAIRMAKRL